MDKSIKQYSHLHELFIRNLKEGARPVDSSSRAFVSPVDGVVAQYGVLENETLFHVKGQTYNIEEMLGSKEASKPYLNGRYFILYLSPSHYHRIHSPVAGSIIRQWQLGGKSYPVNELGLRYGKKPLSRNYRLITELEVSQRQLALVKVGAMNVNTIEVTHSDNELQKGDEIGYFSFGSTVVLLCEHGLIQDVSVHENAEVKVGQKIAELMEVEGEKK